MLASALLLGMNSHFSIHKLRILEIAVYVQVELDLDEIFKLFKKDSWYN
jgi:hypothetical protein